MHVLCGQTNKHERRTEYDASEISKTNFNIKIIGGFIQLPDLQILFKFQVNRMKIEAFRNTTGVVNLSSILTFWSMLTSKIIGG